MPGDVNRNRHRNSFFETLYPECIRHHSLSNPRAPRPGQVGAFNVKVEPAPAFFLEAGRNAGQRMNAVRMPLHAVEFPVGSIE